MTQQPSPNNQSPVEKLKQFLRKIESKQNLISALGGITTLIGAIVGAIIFILPPKITNWSGFLVYTPADSDTVNNLESKIDCYRDRIANNPKDAVAYTNLGEAERRLTNLKHPKIDNHLKSLKTAENYHLTARRLDPKSKEVQEGLDKLDQDVKYLEELKKVSASERIRDIFNSSKDKAMALKDKTMTFNQQQ